MIALNNFAKLNLTQKNILTQGVSSALNDAGFIVNYPFVKLANIMNAKSILNISVYEYLWGYEDSMVKLASGIVPNFINFQKFGLMDRVSKLILIRQVMH